MGRSWCLANCDIFQISETRSNGACGCDNINRAFKDDNPEYPFFKMLLPKFAYNFGYNHQNKKNATPLDNKNTNTKKYELTESFRRELLEWYTSVVTLMMGCIHYYEEGILFEKEFSAKKAEMMSLLSSYIEVGRFYFPNVLKKDRFGLEFLVSFYDLLSAPKETKQLSKLRHLERYFTSAIFDMVEPRKRIKDYAKYLALTLPEGKTIEDFIRENSGRIRKTLYY